jgi:hypothetical protein
MLLKRKCRKDSTKTNMEIIALEKVIKIRWWLTPKNPSVKGLDNISPFGIVCLLQVEDSDGMLIHDNSSRALVLQFYQVVRSRSVVPVLIFLTFKGQFVFSRIQSSQQFTYASQMELISHVDL